MVILPAIDIKNGQCVRLYKGDFGTAERVSEDPIKTAESFKAKGAQWLHIVDLDGALEGKPVNSDIIASVIRSTGLFVEIGGGIRSMDDIDFYINLGASRVILGSSAIDKPDLIKQAVREYGDKIAVGIDAKNGKVSGNAWLLDTEIDYIDHARRMDQLGVQYIIFTDISKDGTLSGPNLDQLKKLNTAVSCNIIASGGITNINDIRKLLNLNVYGAICGKSIYKGTLSLEEAIEIAEKR
ncbi:MAG TPA: 1-(5-phosphoribosyl)-5-[(5-phosphoribosylamino)methylideneamino]imidazole-4-carboxamide isomerase [Clostridiales bacterium]|nr:1-(5-phosphoribosyl)-5-[(5-phosphoribosylamino)methylideneamino]imidazole-4-carboxamide isomerase [Clostridiales bacterium]